MPKEDEWVRAVATIAMLKPILAEYSARLRICERAHGGLIRSRAEQFHLGARVIHNHDIPKEFWWAEGHQALKQDWAAGDFSTWIEHRTHLKAFGVTFARADIEKLLPPPNSVKAEMVTHTEEDDEIIRKLNSLAPSAALSYRQAILDLRDDNRVSFRGPALELREAPEQAVTAFEEAIAGLTRAVYERSSKATHVAGERQTVVQLRRFVVAVFHEILET